MGRTNIKRLSPLPDHALQPLHERRRRTAFVLQVTSPVLLPRAEQDLLRVRRHRVQKRCFAIYVETWRRGRARACGRWACFHVGYGFGLDGGVEAGLGG